MSYYNVYNATSGRPAIAITLIRTRTAARRPLTRTTFDSSYTSPWLSAIENRSADSLQIPRRTDGNCQRSRCTVIVESGGRFAYSTIVPEVVFLSVCSTISRRRGRHICLRSGVGTSESSSIGHLISVCALSQIYIILSS
jgi:hypothetical protein